MSVTLAFASRLSRQSDGTIDQLIADVRATAAKPFEHRPRDWNEATLLGDNDDA